MPSELKQINARVTEEIHQGLEELMSRLGMSKAEAIRHCIATTCNQHGIEIEDKIEHGGNRKVKCLWCGHEQPAIYLDCEKCGEDEFQST